MPNRSDKLWNDLSDESSFYGNDEERSRLEELVRNDVLESSSSKPARKSKSMPKTKPAMSGDDTYSDVEVISPPRDWSSRKKGKVSASTDPTSTSKSKKRHLKETSESEGSEPVPEPAKKSTRRKIKTEDRTLTDSDASSPEPEKTSSTKKRKADSRESATSESASPPKKKSARKPESPESTDSGSPSPSPSREQSPDETRENQADESTDSGTPSPSPSPSGEQSPDQGGEPEANQGDESTDDPDESDSDESNHDLEYPDEADPVLPRPDVDLMSQRRANQPISNLVASMPPSTSNMYESGPWIFVKNPHYRGPPAPNPTSFWVEASETIMGGHYPGMPIRRLGGRGGSSAEMTRTRDFMERGILALARSMGLVTGKWMFFLTPDRVDYVWNVIAQATERGELGPESKVATDDGSGKARLIAVYTKNFDDVADVRRVAQRLVELGLIKSHDRPIYYKTDAYTHLDINSNNAWGLKASMYNSRDILARRF